VRTPAGTCGLFSVLRRGRHVLVVTGADPASALAGPALKPYRDLFEVVTGGPRDGHPFRGRRAGSAVLIRPDGYVAARGRPDRMQTVLGYLRDLSGAGEVSRLGPPAPAVAAIR
jgi:hypothetical protein